MDWITWDSTSLQAARYQQEKSVLELEFCDGAIYRYSPVPKPTFEELLRAESKGRYFNLYVRKNFVWERIRPPNQPGSNRDAETGQFTCANRLPR